MPGKYLHPYEDQRNDPDANKDVSLNSISFNRIFNKKKHLEDYKKSTIEGIPAGGLLDKNDFNQRRKSNSNYSPREQQLRMSENGKLICEKMMQATRDETEYFNNKKIYTKEVENSNYKR